MSEKQELIKYLKDLGVDVHTSTKARGYQGFYLKNRIDISKNIKAERFVPTLLHEFAHYIHSKIEPFMERTGGSLEKIFDDENIDFYKEELVSVTNFVDNNSRFLKLMEFKSEIKKGILDCENIIKSRYPLFQRSKKFKEFDKYIKKSDARYLLKYDRVKICENRFSNSPKVISVDTVSSDFADMPEEFCAYIKLRSLQRKQSRISAKMSRLNKYYNKPTELFARFIEGLYLDYEKIKNIAPNSTKRFYELLECGYYKDLYGIKEYILQPHEFVQ